MIYLRSDRRHALRDVKAEPELDELLHDPIRSIERMPLGVPPDGDKVVRVGNIKPKIPAELAGPEPTIMLA